MAEVTECAAALGQLKLEANRPRPTNSRSMHLPALTNPQDPEGKTAAVLAGGEVLATETEVSAAADFVTEEEWNALRSDLAEATEALIAELDQHKREAIQLANPGNLQPSISALHGAAAASINAAKAWQTVANDVATAEGWEMNSGVMVAALKAATIGAEKATVLWRTLAMMSRGVDDGEDEETDAQIDSQELQPPEIATGPSSILNLRHFARQYFYRAHHDESWTSYSVGSGFRSALQPTPSLEELDASTMKGYIYRHGESAGGKTDGGKTPFISVTSDILRAFNNAKRFVRDGEKGICIMVIDSWTLQPGSFAACRIRRATVGLQEVPGEHFYDTEALVWDHIPADAVVHNWRWETIKQSGLVRLFPCLALGRYQRLDKLRDELHQKTIDARDLARCLVNDLEVDPSSIFALQLGALVIGWTKQCLMKNNHPWHTCKRVKCISHLPEVVGNEMDPFEQELYDVQYRAGGETFQNWRSRREYPEEPASSQQEICRFVDTVERLFTIGRGPELCCLSEWWPGWHGSDMTLPAKNIVYADSDEDEEEIADHVGEEEKGEDQQNGDDGNEESEEVHGLASRLATTTITADHPPE